ncbi:MAG: hypothetical protein IKP65_04135 [Alphaproteobacteria bacterium]|nr:hypothetical protein [Alphaproteobacteria bacterium]
MMLQTNTTMLQMRDAFVLKHYDVEPANYPNAFEATTYKVTSIYDELVAEFWTTVPCPNILDSVYEHVHGAVVYTKSGEKIWFNDLNTKNYAIDVIECVTKYSKGGF